MAVNLQDKRRHPARWEEDDGGNERRVKCGGVSESLEPLPQQVTGLVQTVKQHERLTVEVPVCAAAACRAGAAEPSADSRLPECGGRGGTSWNRDFRNTSIGRGLKMDIFDDLGVTRYINA